MRILVGSENPVKVEATRDAFSRFFRDIIDEIVGEVGTKRKQGAIGLLTHGIMTRKDFYACGVICALVPLLNKGFFKP